MDSIQWLRVFKIRLYLEIFPKKKVWSSKGLLLDCKLVAAPEPATGFFLRVEMVNHCPVDGAGHSPGAETSNPDGIIMEL